MVISSVPSSQELSQLSRHFVQPDRDPDRGVPQSGMGIASLVLAIISALNLALLIAVIAVAHATFQPAAQLDSPFNYLLGGWVIAIALLAVCGIVFGIGGLRQPDRRRSMATVGLSLNIGLPLLVMFILLLAITVSPAIGRETVVEHASPQRDDLPAWRSPTARGLQCATVGMAIAAGSYSWKRRRSSDASVDFSSEQIFCRNCKKQLPRASTFCRRCGHTLRR